MTDISNYITVNSTAYAVTCSDPFVKGNFLPMPEWHDEKSALLVSGPRVAICMDDRSPWGYWALEGGRNPIMIDPPFAWTADLNAILEPGEEWKNHALNVFPREHNSRDARDFREFLETNALRLSQETGESVSVVSIGTVKEHGEPEIWTDSFLVAYNTVRRFCHEGAGSVRPSLSKMLRAADMRRIESAFDTQSLPSLEKGVRGLITLLSGNQPASAYIVVASTSRELTPKGIRPFDFYEGFPDTNCWNTSRESVTNFIDVFCDRVSSEVYGTSYTAKGKVLGLALDGMARLGGFVDRQLLHDREIGVTIGEEVYLFTIPSLGGVPSHLKKMYSWAVEGMEPHKRCSNLTTDSDFYIGQLRRGAKALRLNEERIPGGEQK